MFFYILPNNLFTRESGLTRSSCTLSQLIKVHQYFKMKSGYFFNSFDLIIPCFYIDINNNSSIIWSLLLSKNYPVLLRINFHFHNGKELSAVFKNIIK